MVSWSVKCCTEHAISLQRESKFFILTPLLFRRDLTRRGIFVIDVYREDKAVPIFHHLMHSRTSLDIKFFSYFTPSISEEDLLSTIISVRNELLKRNKFEVSPYSSPSLVFEAIQLSMLQNQTTTVDVETNMVERTPAKLRRSPSDLSDRSIKNVTSKVITSVDGVVGEKNSLYFFSYENIRLQKKEACSVSGR